MIQRGNTKDTEAVHALEMGFTIVQVLNLLKLTKKTTQELLRKSQIIEAQRQW